MADEAHEERTENEGRTENEEWTQHRLTQHVFEVLRDELLDVDESFTTESNLVEAGLDSLAVTQLMLSIEQATGVWVDESLLTPENLESATSLAACVHAELAA